MLDLKVITTKCRALPKRSTIIISICVGVLLASFGIVYAMKNATLKELECIESPQEAPRTNQPTTLLGNIDGSQLKKEIMRYSHPGKARKPCGSSIIGWSNSLGSQMSSFQPETNKISRTQADMVSRIWSEYKDNTYLVSMKVKFDYTSDGYDSGENGQYETSITIKLNTQDTESEQSTIKDIKSIVSEIESRSKEALDTNLIFVTKDGNSLIN